MGIWGRIVGSIGGLSRNGKSAGSGTWTKTWTSNGTRNTLTVTRGTPVAPPTASAVDRGVRTVLTWGNAFKVAAVGAFTYLFLDGGASNVVSTTLGIPQWAGQAIVVFAFVVVLMVVIRFLLDYAHDRFDVTSEWTDDHPRTPRRMRHGNHGASRTGDDRVGRTRRNDSCDRNDRTGYNDRCGRGHRRCSGSR